MKELLLLFTLFAFLYSCNTSSKDGPAKTFTEFKQMEGEWVSDFDEGSFLSWNNQDSLVVATAYSTSDGDTLLTEIHTMEMIEDSLWYDVSLISGRLPTDIHYTLGNTEQNRYEFITNDRTFPRSITYELEENQFFIHREGILAGVEQEITETYLKRSANEK